MKKNNTFWQEMNNTVIDNNSSKQNQNSKPSYRYVKTPLKWYEIDGVKYFSGGNTVRIPC